MSKVVPRSPIECECSECAWQGRWAETDSGLCPECGGECYEDKKKEEDEEAPGDEPGA